MSDYAKLKKMSELISEVHIQENALYACVNNYNIQDFLTVLNIRPFDNESGLNAILRDGYMVIPDFQNVLEYQFDMSLEEAKEYFNLEEE